MASPTGNSQGNIFLKALGSFWTRIFKDKGVLRNILHGAQIRYADLYFRFCEIALGSSLKDIPVFSQSYWRQITWRKSQINTGAENLFKYGDEDLRYGDEGVVYGGKFPSIGSISLPLPDDMVDVGSFICNKIYSPSLVLSKGQDFTVRNGVVVFGQNIFENSFVPQRDIFDAEGNVIDTEVSFWSPKVFFDKKYLFRNYGSIVGIERESSQEYKTFLNTIFALFMDGPKNRIVEGFVNAVFDLPVIIEDEETVRFVIEEPGVKKIVTDKNIYDLDLPDNAKQFAPGDVLKQFTPLYDIISIFDFRTNPSFFRKKEFLTIPINLLNHQYQSDLMVKKKYVSFDFKLGTKFKIDFIADVDDSLREKLENFPVHIGMKGLKLGQKANISIFDYFLEHIQRNIFVILMKNNQVEFAPSLGILREMLDLSIPATCAYLLVAEISDNLDDTYNVDDIDDTDIEIGIGVTPEDIIDIDVDMEDGFFGLPKIGLGLTVGSFIVGSPTFVNQPHVLIIKRGSCE